MSCYCHKCKRYFHPLGIMRHRAMHRDKKETVKITFSDGRCSVYDYGKKEPDLIYGSEEERREIMEEEK